MKHGFLWILFFLVAIPFARSEFKVLGPVETLDNGVVQVEVALKVGRIVSYQKKGGENWLAVKDKAGNPDWHWNPYGGDRVWPSSQALCIQIYGNRGFDPVIDGQPWKLVSRTPDSLVMQSGFSPELGITITRRIQLVKNSTDVIHTFTLDKTAGSRFPVHIWTISGLRKGGSVLMESDRRVGHYGWKPFKWWLDVSANAPDAKLIDQTRILQVPIAANKFKLGTYGRWVALVDGNAAFMQQVDYDAKELFLEASNLQAFSDPETATYEIETLSPSWFLQAGEKREWTVKWRLIDFSAAETGEKEKAAVLDKIANPVE